ncbi:MAG: hypothetical protein ACREBU_23095, partial [Nitrososphaera sp.]
IGMDQGVQIAEDLLGDRETALSLIEEIAENGILSITTLDDGKRLLEFRYQSHHEYFAARRIASMWMDSDMRRFRRLVRQENWHEIIALAAGIVEMRRKRGGEHPRIQDEKQLVQYLKKRREIVLAGMCVWNMEGMSEELKSFEEWLVQRATTSCHVLTRVANYFLFYLTAPLSLAAVFVVTVAARYEYYIWTGYSMVIGTQVLFSVIAYCFVPFFLYLAYRRVASWIAERQEALVLRPSLAALYFIGSDFARASIVDLFANRDIVSSLDVGDDDFGKLNPTIRIQREALRGIADFSPDRPYSPSDLLELVRNDADIRDIAILSKIVAKDFSSDLLHSLARIAAGNTAIARKAYEAGRLLVQTNMELKEQWDAVIEVSERESLYQP